VTYLKQLLLQAQAQEDNKMAKNVILTKRVAIDKTNAQTVVLVAVAAFVSIFCLVASKAVWNQNSYQQRVTSAQNVANKQLSQDISSYNQLKSSYEAFVSAPTNVIGGTVNGNTGNNGNNAKIILDSLPASYDFPALTSTIDNILTSQKLDITGISGTDQELTQGDVNSSTDPSPVAMPFSFGLQDASYTSVGQLVDVLQSSIRPIQIDTIQLTGSSDQMTLNLSAHTNYQPGKTLNITKQVVK
jgi:hypothetical protein